MKLTDIIQMQKDRSNGVVLSQITIDKLIGHALMREIEANQEGRMNTIKTLDQRFEEHHNASITVAEQLEMSRAEVAELKQALADKDLALMEQTEIAQAANRQAEEAREQAQIAASEELRNKLMYAAIDCGHAISYNEITLYREDGEEGNALHQLSERLIAAAITTPQQHAQAAQPDKLQTYLDASQELDALTDNLYGGAQAVLSDEQIIDVLHSCGIDTYPSVHGLNAVQVSATSLPWIREVVQRCSVLIGAPVAATVPPRRFNWTRDGMEHDADGAYCYASDAQPSAAQGDALSQQADWMECERISNEDHVDEALRAFREDPTQDNATGIIQAAITVYAAARAALAQRAASQPDSERDAALLKFFHALGSIDFRQFAMHRNPCWRIEEDGSFCGRDKNWAGHTSGWKYVSLKDAIDTAMAAQQGEKG